MPARKKINGFDSAKTIDPVVKPEQSGGNSALTRYYRDVSQTSMLTPVEEIRIGKKIARAKDPVLQRLAIDTLVQANLRLVLKMANKYRNRGMSLEDLIQEGNMGLMKAASRFKIEKNCRFSTYAVWWIRQAMARALSDRGHTIRMPVHAEDKIRKFFRFVNHLSQKLEREPTMAEIAEEMETTVEKVHQLYMLSDLDCCSLDAPIQDHEASSFIGMQKNNNSPDPLVDLERKMNAETVRNALAGIQPRKRIILEQRYGITGRGHEEKTLQQIGESMDLTRERIRQLQVQAQEEVKRNIVGSRLGTKKKPCSKASRA